MGTNKRNVSFVMLLLFGILITTLSSCGSNSFEEGGKSSEIKKILNLFSVSNARKSFEGSGNQ